MLPEGPSRTCPVATIVNVQHGQRDIKGISIIIQPGGHVVLSRRHVGAGSDEPSAGSSRVEERQ